MEKPRLTGSALENENLTSTGLRLADIPRILFDELSVRVGSGEESSIRLSYGDYRLRRLAENHELVGFPGAIGLRQSDGTMSFALWGCCPKPTDCETVFEPRPSLKIKAGPVSGGVWAYGRGNLISEAISAELAACCGLDLESPIVTLVSLILVRAHQLARDPSLVKQAYWDGFGEKP